MKAALLSFLRLAAVFCIAGSLLPQAAKAESLTLLVTPQKALMDEPLQIQVRGAVPGTLVRVNAAVRPHGKVLWSSSAQFRADARGVIDLAKDAPVRGSYSGVDAMGLIWSMHQATSYAGLGAPGLAPLPYVFSASTADGFTTHVTVRRLRLAENVSCGSIEEGALVAYVCRPKNVLRAPAIIVLGGSEGGEQRRMAAMFAAHGFVSAAVAYFGVTPLPSILREIPVEDVGRALAWLQSQPFVDREHIGVWGGSKGGELALLSASHYPELHAVVSQYGSPMMWYGWRGDPPKPPTSSWSIDGKPTPYVPYRPGPQQLVGIDAPQFIPIERINGPILFVAGADDKEWPSLPMARLGLERLTRAHHPFPDRLLAFSHAGHGFSAPFYPVELLAPLGGTMAGNEKASVASWRAILRFFHQYL